MKVTKNTLRYWLVLNGYNDVALLIDDIISEWEKNGNKQRRNWWDVLAGDKFGNPRIIAGRTIPVLKAAQIRKGVEITENAISRHDDEVPPYPVNSNNRWNSK